MSFSGNGLFCLANDKRLQAEKKKLVSKCAFFKEWKNYVNSRNMKKYEL